MSFASTPYNIYDLQILQSLQTLEPNTTPAFPTRVQYYGENRPKIMLNATQQLMFDLGNVTELDTFFTHTMGTHSDNSVITLAPATATEQYTLGELYKYQIMHDLLTNGLPASAFSSKITLTWQQKVYTFNLEDVAILDLARFPSENHMNRVDVVSMHTLELAETPALIPAVDNTGKSILFTAKNRAGTDLYEAFLNGVKKYRITLNRILTMIAHTKFTTTGDTESTLPSTLWTSIYGTTDSVAMIERVHLQ